VTSTAGALSREAGAADESALARRLPLDPRQVVDAALQLIEQGGVSSLTIRRLCEVLGVTAPSVYWHVKNKEDLLRLIAEEVLERVPLPSPDDQWTDQLRQYFNGIRRALLRHPGLITVVLQQQPLAPSVRAADALLGSLLRAGFPPEDAYDAYTALGVYSSGQILWVETLGGAGRGRQTTDVLLHDITASDFGDHPYLDEVLPVAGQYRFDEQYHFGFERLLEGISARLERALHDRTPAPSRRRKEQTP
jgi:TetR/AcrR family tetracycline transcriptional repressor